MPQGDDKLFFCFSGCGPIFGGGHDICISDDCNNRNSSANFPQTYNRPGENRLANNKDTYRMFSGGDTYNFKVVDYEVFKLSYS